MKRDMGAYYRSPVRYLVKYPNGRTRRHLAGHGYLPKKGKIIGAWCQSTGKPLKTDSQGD